MALKSAREVAAYAAAFTGPLAGNAVLAMLGVLGAQWDVSTTDILLSIPAFMFPFAFAQIFSGAIADAYDKRVAVVAGLVIYAIASFMSALSTSFGFFLITRVGQGIGYAFVGPVVVAMLSDVAGEGRQGLVMGYYGSVTTAGVASGPLVGGLLVGVDWRLPFVFIGVLALCVSLLMWWLFGTEHKAARSLSGRAILRQLGETASNPNVALLSAAGFLTFMASVGTMAFMSDYLESDPLYLSPADIGIVLSSSGLVGIVVSPFAGSLVDSRGPKCCVSVGLLIFASAVFLLQLAEDYGGFLALACVLGLGTSFVWSALFTMVVRSYPQSKGTASSIFNSSRFFGYAFSTILLTPVFVWRGFDAVMLVCFGAVIASMGLSLSTRQNASRR